MKKRLFIIPILTTGLIVPGLLCLRAQEPVDQNQQAEGASTSQHADCTMFGPQRERFINQQLHSLRLGLMTNQVSSQRAAAMGTPISMSTATTAGMPTPPGGTRTSTQNSSSANLIDGYIFGALKAQNVTPARITNDYEFIRRITLDMTGRIPTAAAVQSFVANTSPTKRADLIESLFTSPQWLDKWTMYFGDQFKSASSFPSSGTRLYAGGRDGLNTYIRNALTNGTSLDKIAKDFIASQGTNNYTQGELNWIITSRVTGGPVQDVWDGEAAAVAETFLGISHVNCLLCHNGRGHLDTISLWAGGFTRMQAWGLSSFFAHVALRAPAVDSAVTNGPTYWYADDNGYKTDYALNTTTGNRPARQPVGTIKTVAPLYPFSTQGALSGMNYRQSIAAAVVADRAVRPRRRQLHVGVFLRHGHRRSARPVRSCAPRSQQSSAGALDASAVESATARSVDLGFYRQPLRYQAPHANDRELAGLSTFFRLRSLNVERRLAASIRPQAGPSPLGRGDRRFPLALERNRQQVHVR